MSKRKKNRSRVERPKVEKPSYHKKSKSLVNFKWTTIDFKALGVILMFTFAIFYNTTQNGFVNWDDDKNFYENELITSLNDQNFWSNSIEIFKTPVIGNYNPLTIWTFLVNHKIHGIDDPAGWHFTNVILHLLAVFMVYLIGRRLKLNWIAASFLTLLFAVHPLRVESVAWVTERKDVLFGSTYLIALYQYLRFKQDGNRKAIKWIVVFFLLSLLSKIQAVSLPLSMIAIDYYLDKRWSKKSLINKWPYFIMSLVIGLVGIYFLKDQGSIENTSTTYEFWQRIFIGSYSYCVYLVKTVVPYRMSPLYPYPSQIPVLFYISFAIVPILLWGLYIALKKEYKAVVFGLLFFIFNIVFLLQVLGAGQGFLADRFTYIAHIGLYFIMAFYLQKGLMIKKLKTTLLGLAGAMILTFSYLTYQQNKVWKDSGTLWSHVLTHYTNTKLPYGNRANFYRDQGELDKAMSDYNSAIALGTKGASPQEVAQTYNSRARLYFDHSNNRDTLMLALKDYSKAIELKPNDGEFYTNRGATYARLGDLENALKDLSKGISLNPNHTVAYLNRSLMYNAQNRPDLALKDLNTYLSLNPNNSDIWYEKGRLHFQMQQYDEALNGYDTAIKLNKSKGLYYYMRSRAYFALGNNSSAKSDLQYAKSLNYQGIDPAYDAQFR